MVHPKISKIFVLMLENRSFDHMLGASGLPGIDGILDATGNVKPGCFNVNSSTGSSVSAYSGATDPFVNDPPHEFCDVLLQLSGKNAISTGGKYPPINNSGFIDSFSGGIAYPGSGRVPYKCCRPNTRATVSNPNLIMGCFKPGQLPILTTLAREYAVCNNWFSSLPGPTWPNRYYAHAASSAGLDDSPNKVEISRNFAIGQRFEKGTIFDSLDQASIEWEIFCGDHLPQSFALHGMSRAWFKGKFSLFESFASKIKGKNYKPQYIFIEPDYGKIIPAATFKDGNSQHPIDGIAGGEQLIRDVYKAIRESDYWENCMLIITYDEHGGFYDHVSPGAAIPPGDKHLPKDNNKHGFGFDQLGVRVPAVIVSPYVSPGTVSNDEFSHSSIVATVCRQFGIDHLTASDAAANDLFSLLKSSIAQDGISPEDMPDAPQRNETNVTFWDDIPPGMPIKPITRGFLNVAVLKHQAIEGHNLEKDNFINILEYGIEKPHLMAPETADRFREIIDQYNAIKDERSAQEYILEVIRACEQHMDNYPYLYGLVPAGTRD